jgi:acetyltransferase EpsM
VSERPVLVCGARTFAPEVADVVGDTPGFRVIGFVENEDRERCSSDLDGRPVHWVEDIGRLASSAGVVCGLATTHRTRFTRQVEAMGFQPAIVVHPAAHVSSGSTLGLGSIAFPGVVVGSHTEVGRHVLLNRGALVGHHTVIGDHVSLLPGANVAGNCCVGECTYVGMGALVLNGVSVGAYSVIGAGAVVTRDVPERVQVVGVPARIVREGIEGR